MELDPRLLLHFAHPGWPAVRGEVLDGYSILLPVPSDLPLFYRFALRCLSGQVLRNANEIIVIPDHDSSGFETMVGNGPDAIDGVPIRYCPNSLATGIAARLYGRPSYLHSAQILRGIGMARSRYVLLHDADLFLDDRDFIEEHYACARARGLAALGVNPVWDPWFGENGFAHVTATWEMMLSTEWARSFLPVRLTPHIAAVRGKKHKFDTLLYAQCVTDPEIIATRELGGRFVHFYSVIVTYRRFLRSRSGFPDDRFIIMLLRLLIDEFDPTDGYEAVPTWAALEEALTSRHQKVAFPDPASGVLKYWELRGRIDDFLRLRISGPDLSERIIPKLARFDEFYTPTE